MESLVRPYDGIRPNNFMQAPEQITYTWWSRRTLPERFKTRCEYVGSRKGNQWSTFDLVLVRFSDGSMFWVRRQLLRRA